MNDKSNAQIESWLQKLKTDECVKITEAMHVIKRYLTIATTDLNIRSYRQSDVEYVIDRQLSLYDAERHFTSDTWKKYLTEGVLSLVERFDDEKDCMYILELNGNPAGCIAITHAENNAAQLRYFFIEPELRGLGGGRKLLDMALQFCREKHYQQVFLWTISAQETARKLYANAGFEVTETSENTTWGVPVVEERWDMDI